ncbi:hypothetical protein QBC42DRAFT_282628 [Cladorrhinum samala]|uniref:Ketoreductase domain-containing protein n=1 Tax=Cladorrhinum samala TaxID=585594 RepID=A0AAV9HZT7_9PEZI|nr:hypothetical protein QBC42DRAFT_282628 [Cladorrhinum samala]
MSSSTNPPLTFLITGCSSGLGLSLSRLVLSRGHRLIATSRNPSRTPDLVSEIQSLGGRWFPLDVNSLTAGPELVSQLERDEGTQIDVLINNAGFSIHAPVETLTERELRDMMETLYFGPARLMRAVLPHMRERRRGMVVNISSGAGIEGRASMGGYAASKAALDGMTKVLAQEVAPFGVRVLTVQLGAFNTNMTNASRAGEVPMPEDYKGTAVDQVMQHLLEGGFDPDGDAEKAVKAIYEVVVGDGVGRGREEETMLPLGRDMFERLKKVTDGYTRVMEVFGEVCNNVHRDRR